MDSHIYVCTQKNGKIVLNFFTQNALLIQENCAKTAYCGKICVDSQICQNFSKIVLRNFAIF